MMHDLQAYNTYHIKAYAKYLYFPNTKAELISIYDKHKNIVTLGNGSNVILADENYIDTAFVVIKKGFNQITLSDETSIYAQAGVLLKELSSFAYDHGLSGVETFFDVPASVGGAMIMNVGAYGDEIYDHVAYIDVYCLTTKQEKKFTKSQIDYGYRYSYFKNKPYIILGACFCLTDKSPCLIQEKMTNILAQRQSKLPQEPSAGSVFKRPNYHITVGEMLEKINLKGYQIGGAQISLKHGGIIINKANATGQDVLALINFIKVEVKRQYEVALELEQIAIYDDEA